jgi:ATP-dependent DNA helicase PIF1
VKTIHSWSGVRLCQGTVAEVVQRVLKDRAAVKAWKNVKCLLIDEVSMLSRKMFDALDQIGCLVRRNARPFGGIQVVFLGDMYQLAPIPDGSGGDDPSGQFCFESDRWYETVPRENHVELTRIYRQKDAAFQEILNQVRVGELTEANAAVLRGYIGRPLPEHGIRPIRILPTRAMVNAVNETEYAKVAETEHVFEGRTKTEVRLYLDSDTPIPTEVWMKSRELSPAQRERECTVLRSNTPVEGTIRLKRGVPVMCLVNVDLDAGVANGSLGVVEGFTTSAEHAASGFGEVPVVRFSNGVVRALGPHHWQHSEYPNLVYSQVPLALSYSSTIHKLQGSTLDLAEMNLGGSVFADGQIYVGLSRVKALEGLYLTAFHANKIKVNAKVKEFYAQFG